MLRLRWSWNPFWISRSSNCVSWLATFLSIRPSSSWIPARLEESSDNSFSPIVQQRMISSRRDSSFLCKIKVAIEVYMNMISTILKLLLDRLAGSG